MNGHTARIAFALTLLLPLTFQTSGTSGCARCTKGAKEEYCLRALLSPTRGLLSC
jgi:hypothetical protein